MKKKNTLRWRKTLAMFLALAMPVCTPLGAAGAYAMEGEPPSGDAALILDESQTVDSGLPPLEVKSQPNDATPSEATSAAAYSSSAGVKNATELRDAIMGASDGDTISIDANIDLTATLTIGKSITLTSSGSTLNMGEYTIIIAAGANVTFGGSLAIVGSTLGVNASVISVETGGSFTLAGSASVAQTSGAFAIDNNGTVTIADNTLVENSFIGINNASSGLLLVTGGVIRVSGPAAALAIRNFGTLTVSNGTIGSISGNTYGILVWGGSTTSITGGTIYGGASAVFVNDTGTLNISGGNLETGISGPDTRYTLHCGGTAKLTGGTFTNGEVMTEGNGSIDIDLRGSGSLTLPSTGVRYNDGGWSKNYLTELPSVPITITSDQQSYASLTGVSDGVVFDIASTTSGQLGASMSGDTAVSMTPTAAGSYSLVLTAGGTGAASAQSLKLTLPVTVTASTNVCQIGDVQYSTLDDALSVIGSGQTKTIKLLSDITYNKGIVIAASQHLTFDLDGHNLSVVNLSGTGLEVSNGSVDYEGTGIFNVTGKVIGTIAKGSISSAKVTNTTATEDSGNGALAESGGRVIVVGNAIGGYIGASAVGGGSKITVGGNAAGIADTHAEGACALNGGVVTITGNAIGVLRGASARYPGGMVTVGGDALGTGDNSFGARADDEGIVSVSGNVRAAQYATLATNRGRVSVTGNSTATRTENGWAAYADWDGEIEIGGNAVVQPVSLGVYVAIRGKVTVGGEITNGGSAKAAKYIQILNAQSGSSLYLSGAVSDRTEPTTKSDYYMYSDGISTVWVKEQPSVTYALTVQNGTGDGIYAQGTTVTITASGVPAGQRFKEWTISPAVTFTGGTNKTDATAMFIMPAQAVTATASYELLPVVSYTVTFNLNGGTRTGGGELAQAITSGGSAIAPTVTRSNYTLTGWDRAFTNITSNLTITANWSYSGGAGDGPSSGGGGGSYTPEPPKPAILTEKQPDMPTTAMMSVSGMVKDGSLSADITEQITKDAIKAALDAAKKSGKEVDGIAVEFGITNSGSYTSLNAAIDAGAIDRLKEAGVKFIKISSAILDVTLDTEAIAEIDRKSTGIVIISAKTLTKLSKAAKALIGSRPVLDITVGYLKNGKTEHITSFGKGVVTVGIAYKAASNEKTGNLFGVYISKSGRPKLITNSSYADGRLIFSRNSLLTYGVGYKTPVPVFTDTVKHWAKDNIDFIASRDLITGTSNTTFTPDTDITRATFLMALAKLSGADVSGYRISSFTDIKAADPALPFIEWAVKSKIVQGIDNNKFGPDQQITREQMAVMMVNYAKAIGYTLPVSRQTVTFADDAKVSSWAKDAVKSIQQTGIMNGKNYNLFDPAGNVTRAEASTILRRFIELVIDEGTARGWVQNDSGQWCYFNTDGSLAKNINIDDYEIDGNGVRKIK